MKHYENVEIWEHAGSGFLPLVFFEGWRVAILNHQPSQVRGQVPFVERHHDSDEVFVLLHGSATLLLAGTGDTPTACSELVMEPGLVYNVPKDLWHAVLTEADSKLLIVENADVSEKNSSYYNL